MKKKCVNIPQKYNYIVCDNPGFNVNCNSEVKGSPYSSKNFRKIRFGAPVKIDLEKFVIE